jgi:3',5'-cyclic AMP phosphodiesterase CpdA
MKLIHFTDSHVQTVAPSENQFSVQPLWRGDVRPLFERLAVLAADADALIFSGDATHGGHVDGVELFFELLAVAAQAKPVFMVMGNHDVTDLQFAENFQRVAALYPNVQFRPGIYQVGDFDLVLVDNEYLSPAGVPVPYWRGDCFPVPVLSDRQAVELEKQLGVSADRPAIVVVHCPTHAGPPVLVDSGHPLLAGMKQYQQGLHVLLNRHPRVRRVLSGHIHFSITQHFEYGRVHQSLGSMVEHPHQVRVLEEKDGSLTSRIVDLARPTDLEWSSS